MECCERVRVGPPTTKRGMGKEGVGGEGSQKKENMTASAGTHRGRQMQDRTRTRGGACVWCGAFDRARTLHRTRGNKVTLVACTIQSRTRGPVTWGLGRAYTRAPHSRCLVLEQVLCLTLSADRKVQPLQHAESTPLTGNVHGSALGLQQNTGKTQGAPPQQARSNTQGAPQQQAGATHRVRPNSKQGATHRVRTNSKQGAIQHMCPRVRGPAASPLSPPLPPPPPPPPHKGQHTHAPRRTR